ncbi:MAG TPA: hypothetical protein VGB55_12845 [Tepidisphaeraceae bacterium]|jgi:hypothetical protein
MSSFAFSTRRRGLTLVELTIGILFTTIIGAAVSAFCLALSTQWRAAEHGQHLDVTVQQARGTIGPIIQSSRRIGGVFQGSKPAIFLWHADDLGGVSDGKPQFGEMAVVEYDPTLQSLFYYSPNRSLNLLSNVLANLDIPVANMLNPLVLEFFLRQTWLNPRRVLLGPGRVRSDEVDVTRVTEASFSTRGNLQGINMQLTLQRGGETVQMTEFFALRVPFDQPVGKGIGF